MRIKNEICSFVATLGLLHLAFSPQTQAQMLDMTRPTGSWGLSGTELQGNTVADFWNPGEELRFDCAFEEKITPTRKRKSVLRGSFDLGPNGQTTNHKIIAGTTALLLDSVHYSKFDVTYFKIKADPLTNNFYAFLNLAIKPKVENPKIKEIQFQFDEPEIIFPPPPNPLEPNWVKKLEHDNTTVQLTGSAYCRIKRR